MMLSSSVAVSVKRVVTCFILSSSPSQKSSELTRESVRIAVFRRRDTMQTYASHWAGVSGSMEEGEEPWQTAVRELQEETNLVPVITTSNNKGTNNPLCYFVKQGGLYLDVPFRENRKIRVYPFVVHMKDTPVEKAAQTLQLLGTEHYTFQFVSVSALEQLEPAVPGLATAFHHATAGAFLPTDALPEPVWKWAEDRENGAATLARKAIDLAMTTTSSPSQLPTMTMLRPSMVPIVNVLRALEQKLQNGEATSTAAKAILKSLDEEADQSIQLGVDYLTTIYQEYRQICSADQTTSRSFTIATFSRSSTILKVLERFVETSLVQDKDDSTTLHIMCAKSTPGDEGVLMAKDLTSFMGSHSDNKVLVECVEDETLHQNIRDAKVDVVVVGSDCVLDDQIVNKVGTNALAEICHNSKTRLLCCTDQWKFWDDVFPPPLEDIFECVPRSLMDYVAMHQPDQQLG